MSIHYVPVHAELYAKCDHQERIELLDKGLKVLLPAYCNNGKNTYNVNMLRAIMKDDKCSILITGQSGTGKEFIFKCIKKYSSRPKGKIMELNCAGLSDSNFVDSALFGHVKGAFTGATGERDGIIKKCQDGILFLDEIGWFPKESQAKLLRFMETGEYFRLGSDDPMEVKNVRVIAATNKKVFANDAEKNRDDRDDNVVLLHDLYFRFDHHIELPTLNERGSDLFWFLAQPGFLGESDYKRISLRMLFSLLQTKWDGNIRQLKKFCETSNFMRKVTSQYAITDPDTVDDVTFVRKDGEKERRIFASYFTAGLEKYEKDIIIKKDFNGDDAMASHYVNSQAYQHVIAIFGDIYSSVNQPGVTVPIDHLEEILFGLARPEEAKADSRHPGILYTGIISDVVRLAGFRFETSKRENIHEGGQDEYYSECIERRYDDEEFGLNHCTFLGDAINIINSVTSWADQEDCDSCYVDRKRMETSKFMTLVSKFQYWIDSFETPKREVQEDLEELLTRLGLDARMKAICRYCSQGLSSPIIELKLKDEGMERPSKDCINKDLRKLLAKHKELNQFIDERKPGRRRDKLCPKPTKQQPER
jgi:Cdc6-like AAA superfamily ATPase